jgi:hypothetical protein
VWRWDSHSQKWEFGVLRDSRNFRARQQRAKHLSLRCSLNRWKGFGSVDVENGLAWAIWTFVAQVMGKRRAGSQTGSLTPNHKKSGIDPIPVCADGVRHTVGKLLRRATSLLQTSSQSKVWAGSYEFPKSRESKPGQFRDSSLGVLGIKVIWMRVLRSNA